MIDVSVRGSRANFWGSPSLAHLIRDIAQSIPHPTESSKNRSLWDARDDVGPFTGNLTLINGNVGSFGVGVEMDAGADFMDALVEREAMDADTRSTGVKALGSGSDFTVFLQRIGVRFFCT
jgi:N-acetylated-alpha-linked acidic dipeptidase